MRHHRKLPLGSDARDLWLLLHAVRLALVARRLWRSTPLAEVLARALALSHLPRGASIEEALRATGRALWLLSRCAGAPNTCLVRSVVLGCLLADQPSILLHLGFRPGPGSTPIEGHAWLTAGGRSLPDPLASSPSVESYDEAAVLPLARPPRARA